MLIFHQNGIAANLIRAPIVPDFQALYEVKYDGIKIGTSSMSLHSNQQGQYFFAIHNQASIPFLSGDVIESSTGFWSDKALMPTNYIYHYRYFNRQQQIEMNFNWQTRHLVIRVNGQPWHLLVPPLTQDRLSYQLALRRDLLAGKNQFSYWIADGGKIKNYQFRIVGNETITTPLGTFNTIKIKRLPIPGKENVTLWLAKQWDYQVIKVEQTKNIVDQGSAEIVAYSPLNS
jgi:hypothetical protein